MTSVRSGMEIGIGSLSCQILTPRGKTMIDAKRMAEYARIEINQIIGKAQGADRELTEKELDRITALERTESINLQKASGA